MLAHPFPQSLLLFRRQLLETLAKRLALLRG